MSVIPLLHFFHPKTYFSSISPSRSSLFKRCRLSPAVTMYSELESYPVMTTRPTDPQHKILHYTLTKSAVLSSQASIQVAFPRPTVFIPSSCSSSHSSGSSPRVSNGRRQSMFRLGHQVLEEADGRPRKRRKVEVMGKKRRGGCEGSSWWLWKQ